MSDGDVNSGNEAKTRHFLRPGCVHEMGDYCDRINDRTICQSGIVFVECAA